MVAASLEFGASKYRVASLTTVIVSFPPLRLVGERGGGGTAQHRSRTSRPTVRTVVPIVMYVMFRPVSAE